MGDRSVLDPVERLIAAWEAWELEPRSRATAVAKEDALAAMRLSGIAAHELIAGVRRRHVAGQPGGMDVPSAVQSFVNDLLKEAS